jgi:dipeptidyl aminopeptidase/acylaminoacyl peptidase
LLLAHDHRARVELYRLDLSTGSLEDVGAPRGTVSDARVRPDGEVWYSWSDAATPAQVRSSSGEVVLRPEGDPAPSGVPYADHSVGEVHVLVAKPQGAGPHPVMLSIHGGPTWHDRDAFSPLVQAYVDHGFAVVLVNYRGSTGYGKAWRDALEGNPGLTELEDIGAVHDWLVEQPWVDRDRIALSGASWGGYLTLLGLGTQPDRWTLGLAGVPVADYVAAYEDEMEPLKAFDRSIFGGSPEGIPGEYEKRSPITYATEVRAPVLILAGANDPRCPIRQIDRYLDRLAELGKPHEVYRYDAGHGSLVIEETIRQTEVELAFASRHLGTPAPG